MANNTINGMQIRQKMLQAITEYIQQHGYPPTIREIGDMVGRSSAGGIKHQLDKMLAKGQIETDVEPGMGSPRAIRVPGYVFVKEEVAKRLTPQEVTPYAPSYDPSDNEIIDCPSCKHTYWSEDWGTINFCPNCGQAFTIKEKKNED